MNKVTIRNYKIEDYNTVKEILEEGQLYDATWDNEKQLEKRITNKPDSILVSIVDSNVVGCVYIVDDVFPFIFRLVVKKQYRERGIGTMLINEAIKILKDHGHNEISLFADNNNEELKNWYLKLGFKKSTISWVGFWKKI